MTSSQAGRSHRVVPVFRDLDGSAIEVHIHTIDGAAPGPTLSLISGTHGSEWFSHEILRRVYDAVDPKTLCGRLIVSPVSNPYAFRTTSRYSADPQQVGYVNMNKAFLRPENSLTSLISRVLASEVIQPATHLIDFHPGPWGSAWKAVVTADGGPVGEASRIMADAFGVPCVFAENLHEFLPNSSAQVCVEEGVAYLTPEVGGLGFGHEADREWLDANVDGVLSVMDHLGMRAGVPAHAPEPMPTMQILWDLRADTAGMLVPAVTTADLLRSVHEGQLLATLYSPVTFEVLQELRAPGDGVLVSLTARMPVHPYNFGYVIAGPAEGTT